MPTLMNKLQQQKAVREACEAYEATDPYFHDVQGTPDDPRSEHMLIHHTTIKTNVREERYDAFAGKLSTISNQSDDVNRFAIMRTQRGPVWEVEILVGRVKPQEDAAV